MGIDMSEPFPGVESAMCIHISRGRGSPLHAIYATAPLVSYKEFGSLDDKRYIRDRYMSSNPLGALCMVIADTFCSGDQAIIMDSSLEMYSACACRKPKDGYSGDG